MTLGSGETFLYRAWHALRWVLIALGIAFVALLLWRIPGYNTEQKAKATVPLIHAQRLTLADADGSHLPPQPDPKEVDATVAGVDANKNGIRDDVELAIFKKYPTSPYTRAAELQYAMTEQMFLTSVFDTATWKAVAEVDDRASTCLDGFDSTKSLRLQKEVEDLIFNTAARKSAREEAFKNITSYGTQVGNFCDVNASELSH